MHTVHGEPAGDESTIGVINIVDALARRVIEPGVGLKVLDVVTVEHVARMRGRETRARRHRLAGDAVQIVVGVAKRQSVALAQSKAVRSEEHSSELQSLMRISYAVFCLKKKKQIDHNSNLTTTD